MYCFHEVRQYEDGFMVWHGSYRDMSFLAHRHEETELIYVREGAAEIHIGERHMMARAGDLVVCGSGQVHYSRLPPEGNRLEFLLFNPYLVDTQFVRYAGPGPLLTREMLAAAGLTELVKTFFAQAAEELTARPPYYREIVQAGLRMLWFSLRRRFAEAEAPVDTVGGETARRMQALLTYIDEHHAEPLTLEQAAGFLNFSPCYFSRLFRRHTGMTFVNYLNMVRVEQAALMLRRRSRKIVDIACDCGFNNARTFNRTFRQVTGYSPTEFLRQDTGGALLFGFPRTADAVVEQDSYVVMIRDPAKR